MLIKKKPSLAAFFLVMLKGSSDQNNNMELGEGAFVQGGADSGWRTAVCGPGLASAEGERCWGALGSSWCRVLWPWCSSPHVQGFTCLSHPTLCHPFSPRSISWGLLEGWFGCSLCWKDTTLGKHPGNFIFKPGCICPGCPLGGGGMVCTWSWKEPMRNPAK